jgi:hypothetical protein
MVKEKIFVLKAHWATRGVANFYSAGVVTREMVYDAPPPTFR